MDEANRRRANRLLLILAIAALSFLLLVPALWSGALLDGDAPVHFRWQAHFARSVWQGGLYPRWLGTMNDDFGSPAFFFYPPLVQWAGALFHPVAPGPMAAMTRLLLGVWLLSIVGALGSWLWLRRLALTRWAAALGAVLFLLMPYRSFVDIYQRGALAEVAGISVMPWLFHGAVRLHRGERGAWGGYALAVGAILYSHLPSALIGLVASTGYIVALSGLRNWRLLTKGATATLTGFAIGGAMILPALGLLGSLHDTTAMWGERNQPVHWLLFGDVWIDPAMHVVTAALLVLTIVVAGVAAPIGWYRAGPAARRHIAYLSALIVIVAVLNTAISAPFWALQTPLSRIQFPFRLLGADVVALCGLCAIAIDTVVRGAPSGWTKRIIGSITMAFLALNVALFAIQHFRNGDNASVSPAEALRTSADTSEYVLGDVTVARQRFGNRIAVPVRGDAVATMIRQTERTWTLRVDAAVPSRLAMRQFAFTGWRCRLDNGPWVPAGEIAYPLSVPTCDVPASTHLLTLDLPMSLPERLGWLLTVFGAMLALLSMRWPWRMRPAATLRENTSR